MLGLTYLWDFAMLETSYPGIPADDIIDHMSSREIRNLDPDHMEIVVGHYYICHYHKDRNDS